METSVLEDAIEITHLKAYLLVSDGVSDRVNG